MYYYRVTDLYAPRTWILWKDDKNTKTISNVDMMSTINIYVDLLL